MYLVTAEQMKLAENMANAKGLSYDMMMENAGKAVAEAIEDEFGAAGRQVTILIGPGNNGGDGLVAARYLVDLGASVSLYIWRRSDLDDDPNWQRLRDYTTPTFHQADDADHQHLADLLDRSAIVVDALLGTGVSRPIEGSLADLLTFASKVIFQRRRPPLPKLLDPIDPPKTREIGPAIVAVDLPSGLHTDTGALDPLTLPADLTVTFAAPKQGQVLFPGADYIGQLLIADIGIDEAYFSPHLPRLATPPLVAEMVPERPMRGHKGTFGKVLVVAGCLNYTGAPALTAAAAYRVGSGLVTVALPGPVQPMVAANLTEATYLLLPHREGAIASAAAEVVVQSLSQYNALLVGPGLGQAPSTTRFVDALLSALAEYKANEQPAELPPFVFDADALNILASQPDWWTRLPENSILTPHPGEMSRLTKKPIAELEANRLIVVSEMAQSWRQIIIFKGAFTVVANPMGEVVVMPFANPALATAGSGDVLAGCVVGFLGQRLSPFEAAVAGAYLHGLAGELARDRSWEGGVMAGDLLPLLPLALKEVVTGL